MSGVGSVGKSTSLANMGLEFKFLDSQGKKWPNLRILTAMALGHCGDSRSWELKGQPA